MTLDQFLEKTQSNLTEFLNNELDLANTFCDVAKTSQQHQHSALLTERSMKS